MSAVLVSPAIEQAKEARRKIHNVLANGAENQLKLEATWITLGSLLADFKLTEQWRELNYQCFEDFILELRDKYDRGKTQLLGYTDVAEKLLPIIPAEHLTEIGISKCFELKRAVKMLEGKPLPDDIIEKARKPETKIKELRALIGSSLHIADDREQGTWFDLGGCFFTAEERKEFVDALKLAKAHLALAPSVPDHIARKEIMLDFAREYFATWAPVVYGSTEK